jgi:hypothetical protein
MAAAKGATISPQPRRAAIRRFRSSASSDNSTYLSGRERMYEGMRMAGVPEG